jgi:Serine hydrolase (FSH1)
LGTDFESRSFSRFDGDLPKGPVYYLPWRADFGAARRAGLLPRRNFAACYRLPDDIVSPTPWTCADRIQELVDDAVQFAQRHGPPSVVVGYSLGTVPATLLAAQFATRLWSFASADRGDLMIWSSPAASAIKSQAERLGYGRDDFASALHRLNPVDRIGEVHPDSRLVVGRFDRLVPRERSRRLVEKARCHLPKRNVIELPLGHLGVLGISSCLQHWWCTKNALLMRSDHHP